MQLKNTILTDGHQELIKTKDNFKLTGSAGSGKTTLLVLKAMSLAPKQVLVVCYNRAAKEDAMQKISQLQVINCHAETIHSIAFNSIVKEKNYKIVPDVRNNELIQILRIKELPGNPNSSFLIADRIREFLSFFCNSICRSFDDLDVNAFINKDELFLSNHDFIIKKTIELYELMVAGKVPMIHDVYLKLFHLQGRSIHYDYIFFDEGHDASPVMIDILGRQKAQKGIVGDEHQKIYGWRYASNAMASLEYPTIDLKTNFRFGGPIADFASNIIKLKNHLGIFEVGNYQIEGRPLSYADKNNNLSAVIARTNFSLLERAIDLLESNHPLMRKIYFEGNLKSYLNLNNISIYDILNLQSGKRHLIKDPLLMSMRSFNEIKEYASKSHDIQIAKYIELVELYGNSLFKIIKELQAREITDATQKYTAGCVFTSAHKAKGMEYDEIILETDFITEKEVLLKAKPVNLMIEEINLLYVAATRSKGLIHTPRID